MFAVLAVTVAACSGDGTPTQGTTEEAVDSGSTAPDTTVADLGDVAPTGDIQGPAPEVVGTEVVEPTDSDDDPDAGPDVTPPPDAVEPDAPEPPLDVPVVEPDAGEASCDDYPAPAFCPCADDDECASGYCYPTSQGKACAKLCESECPDGYACRPVGAGSDPVYLCVEWAMNLCRPCDSDGDCTVAGFEGENDCVAYGDTGSFCGIQCQAPSDCPAGYSCDDGQCVITDGECACAPLHVSVGAETTCYLSNTEGSCQGSRYCSESGLTACEASTPEPEACDGLDNDCNGIVDDLKDTSCALENQFGACPGQVVCIGGGATCQGEPPGPELCDGLDNDCNGEADDGYVNTDGDPLADCVDPDDDNDGFPDEIDNCLKVANDQLDSDKDGLGNACDPDDDDDGFPDELDCEPLLPFSYPFATELCDGIDNDCDELVDEATCDDGDLCTDDVCSPGEGCKFTFNENPCNDGNPCTANDVCNLGFCQGDFGVCDDGNPCTDDACVDGVCIHTAVPGCCSEDGQCDDGDLCTDDVCSPGEGCKFTFNENPCNDGNPCTANDVCNLGFCQGDFGGCDDGNPCTVDSCTPQTGCTHTILSGPCDDGNACTTGDICGAGGGCFGQPLICDDDSPCTTDSCDPGAGCQFDPNDAPCDDGTVCTEDDHCVTGNCEGTPVVCDDQNGCTDELCDPVLGCHSTPNSAPCNDGDPCTVGDQCAGGVCAADPVDCTVLDGPCQLGICNNGGCIAEEYACNLVGLQIQVPGGGFDAKAPGSFRIQGSVGQPGPAGPADSGGVYRIHYGFSPLVGP